MNDQVDAFESVLQGKYDDLLRRHNDLLSELENEKSEMFQEKPKRFKKPTLQQVKDYFGDKGVIDSYQPETFINYYETVGWKVGGKAPMKNWKAAVSQWIGRIERPKT